MPFQSLRLSRRHLLGLLPLGLLFGTAESAVEATSELSEEDRVLVAQHANQQIPGEGTFSLDIPEYAEDGHFVPLKIWSEGSVAAQERVVRFTLIAPRNPNQEVFTARFTPLSGEAYIQTRIRLATSQTVIALSEDARGEVTMVTKYVRVLVGGCNVAPDQGN